MEILFVLIPVSLIIVSAALTFFVWSVHSNQYDDLDKEAERILFEDTATNNNVVRLQGGSLGEKEKIS